MLWSTKGGASSVWRLTPADLIIYFVSMWGILSENYSSHQINPSVEAAKTMAAMFSSIHSR